MTDILGQLSTLKRPGLLLKAARIAARRYRREQHLRPLLGTSHLPHHPVALLRLSEIESEMNLLRQFSNANYSVTRHIEVLTAMVAEARAMLGTMGESSGSDDQVNASASAALRSATNASSASLIAVSSVGC